MSILNKALMKYCNEYFTMSESEQELFRLTNKENGLGSNIRAFVQKGLGVGNDDDRDHEQSLIFNTEMLPFHGIGPNHFMLNEFDWNEKILKFDNLYHYNVHYHNFQEEACAKDFPNHTPQKLFNRFAAWARAMVNGKFHYLSLLSVEQWLYYEMETVAFDWIDEQLPHDYVPGPNHGKRQGEAGSLWDMQLAAGGKEVWVDAIRDFSYKYQSRVFDEHPNLGNVVFTRDTSTEFDPHIDYVFGNVDVLKEITFRNFVNDCESVKGEINHLIEFRDRKIDEFLCALENELERIKREVPLNVVRLRKRTKIIMADGALE